MLLLLLLLVHIHNHVYEIPKLSAEILMCLIEAVYFNFHQLIFSGK